MNKVRAEQKNAKMLEGRKGVKGRRYFKAEPVRPGL